MFLNVSFVVAILIVICMTYRGYKKGLLYAMFGVIAIVFMVFFTSIAEPYVTQYIKENTPIEQNLHDLIVEDLSKRANELEMKNNDNAGIAFISSLPDVLTASIYKTYDKAKNATIETTADALCYRALTGISSILTMIAGIVIVLIVRAIVIAIGHVRVINKLNRFLGTILGFAEGLMSIWVIMFFASRFVSSTIGHQIIMDCNSNFILYMMYINNPIVWFLG